MSTPNSETTFTGRCYCGARSFSVYGSPLAVAYCHCTDCRRFTGAPVGAFAAFAPAQVVFSPDQGREAPGPQGVVHRFCHACGSPLMSAYEYLPEQVYIPIGVFDDAASLVPQLHAHHGSRLCWLHIDDDLERVEGSSRAILAP